MRRLWLALGAIALMLQLAPANRADDTADTRGIGGPVVITKPGTYTLRRAITARDERPLITIAADDVSLDLSRLTLTGLGDKRGAGIVVEGRTNVSVRNGSLRNFGTAVQVNGSANVRLEDLQITGEDIPGLPPETGILLINTRAAHLSGNVIHKTFLGVFVRGGGSGGNTIKGNTITGGENGQLGICYNPAPGADPATDGPNGDLVAENQIARFRTAIQLSPATKANMLVRNYLAFFEHGIEERTPGSNTLANNLETPLP